MRYKAVLSDFDYTLGDTTEGIVQCVNAGMDALGLPHCDANAVCHTVGLSLERTYRELTGDSDIGNARIFSEHFLREADRDMSHQAYFYDGVIDMLRCFRAHGIRIAVVSTKYGDRIREIFEANGVPDLVDLIIGADDVDREKPDPEGLFRAMERFGVTPSETVFVGDTDVDAEAAYRAGVDFVGVRTGPNPPHEFERYPKIDVLDDVTGLKGIVFGSTSGCDA
ncbi:MAG: HAD family hydrolase [Candidatus Methanomethylophilaceae archaeon]